MTRVRTLAVGFCLFCVLASGCKPTAGTPGHSGSNGPSGDKPTVAYVTNGIASFWVVAEKGALQAGKDVDAEVLVRMPPDGVSDQKRMVQELLSVGIDGIAISPIDPANQGDLLAEIARHSTLITHDSDAPESDRLCYIGMNNYDAGRMCGQLVKEAMPDGGSVMVFVGRLGQLNAQLRRQGLIDELLGRSHDDTRRDPPNDALTGDKYTILGTRTDEFDFVRAKALAQEAIAKEPNLGCMVGLFAYNPPYLLEAVREANKLGQIRVIGFDEEDGTLQGILDGHVYGTVVQNPYQYGYQSVKILAGLARGDESVLPENGFLDIPARKITRDNVQEFWDELKTLTGKSAPAAGESAAESP